ncbi:TRAP transporter small permease [Mesorhizobium sp. M0909]|uniref:TRAP transporter small permease n=1 Tax=Mesorhizobium sp. M0909 TaxID=2957024 RepID=UPI003334F05E
MDRLFAAIGKLSLALAAVAKVVLGLMIVAVVADVCVRNLGLRPLAWAVSATEYGLLYAAFLPMPWLVHSKGHVFVEFLRKALPVRARAVLEKLVYLACIAVSLYLGSVALSSLTSAVAGGEYETRSFDMPKWLVFLPIMLAFYLSALEWLRYLLGRDTLYTLDPLEMEGL